MTSLHFKIDSFDVSFNLFDGNQVTLSFLFMLILPTYTERHLSFLSFLLLLVAAGRAGDTFQRN